MWDPLLQPGLSLLSGTHLRDFAQELCHHALHHRSGTVLWCDGNHGFDPYQMAELNLERGHAADEGAERVLVKRCMTPFQWDTVLTKHLDQKLVETDASLVIVAPFDRLLSTDELADWEQEDYTRYALRHLKTLARRHRVPVLLFVDMRRWWRTHPVLAQMAYEQVHARWEITHPGRWVALQGEQVIDARRQVTLWDFVPLLHARRYTGTSGSPSLPNSQPSGGRKL